MRTSLLALCLLLPGLVQAQAPLSAIDWLERRGAAPAALPPPVAPVIAEPPVARSATAPVIEVLPLDAPQQSTVGLLPTHVTGLPANLWAGSAAEDLSRLLGQLDVTAHPAMTSLLYTLLLAEAEPPADSAPPLAFLRERAAKLLDMGAVEPAAALLDRAGPPTPLLFAVSVETALLTGTPEAACAALRRAPFLSQDPAVRVFCAAREADWQTAVTLLHSAEALGTLTPDMADLLARYLDPELAETAPPLSPPDTPDALQFRLFEAIGERLPTAPLPRRFAVADLGGDSGWKAQIEAAERLARAGAISENRLLGIYSEGRASASGGVWDRVEAIQKFEAALDSRDPGTISAALNRAWGQMLRHGLAVPFADLFGPGLAALALPGQDVATVVLLSPGYESAAATLPATMPDRTLLQAVATGQAPQTLPREVMRAAIATAFGEPALPDRIAPFAGPGRLGEAILTCLRLFETGARGNPADLRDSLQGLRALGLEDTARRAALYLLLVEFAA